VYPEGQRDLPAERPLGGFERPSTPKKTPRAVILEPHPAVRAVLEYLLTQEGYAVEARGEAPFAALGPALLLVATEDRGGLYVFESRDAAETLEGLSHDWRTFPEELSGVAGIRVFVPKPFGARDVVRVVRVVSGFDGRRRVRSRTA
jgi:hypothetical protein